MEPGPVGWRASSVLFALNIFVARGIPEEGRVELGVVPVATDIKWNVRNVFIQMYLQTVRPASLCINYKLPDPRRQEHLGPVSHAPHDR